MGAKKSNEGLAGGADAAQAVAANAGARTFKSVNGKSLDANNAAKDGIKFIRPKELADAGITGVVAEGVFIGTVANNFDEDKTDYKIQTDDGKLIILNSCGSLASQLAKVTTGTYVQIQYLGMQELTQGKMKGKLAHKYVVGLAD